MPYPDEEQDAGLSPLAIGYMWSTRIISLSIEMALIILAFHWIDRKLGTGPFFTVIGTLAAIGVFIVQIVAITKKPVSPSSQESGEDRSELSLFAVKSLSDARKTRKR